MDNLKEFFYDENSGVSSFVLLLVGFLATLALFIWWAFEPNRTETKVQVIPKTEVRDGIIHIEYPEYYWMTEA